MTDPAALRVRSPPRWSLLLLLAAALMVGKAWGLASTAPSPGRPQPAFVQLDRAALAHAPRASGPQFVRASAKLDPFDSLPDIDWALAASPNPAPRLDASTPSLLPDQSLPRAQVRRGQRAREPPASAIVVLNT